MRLNRKCVFVLKQRTNTKYEKFKNECNNLDKRNLSDMKRFTGWLIIIVCTVILLFLVFSVIVVIITLDRWQVPTIKDVISVVVAFVVFTILLLAGLKNGLKKIKKDKIVKVIDYTCTLDINLTGQISYADYKKLMLGLSFKKPVFLVFVCMITILLLNIINNSELSQTYLNIIPFLILGFLLSPVLTLVQVKKMYRTNRIFQEQMNYKLTNDSIHIKGETVDSIQKWTGFYKLKETKGFFMFYQGEGIATLLDKKMFTDNELTNFKRFICSLNLKQSKT